MGPKTFFKNAIDKTSGIVPCVSNDKFNLSTPCSDWDLKQLLNHLVNELLWVPELLDGKTIEEVGSKLDGDLVGSDFAEAWESATKAAIKAVEACDLQMIVHLSYGDMPAEHYVKEMASDVLIHGWDVAQSVQCSMIMGDDLAEQAYRQLEPHIQDYRDGGFVGPEIDVPTDADMQTKLLAIVGRKGV